MGGWGYRTLGLLEPSGKKFKTFGVHGMGAGLNPLTLNDDVAYAKPGHHYNAPTGSEKTHLTVSIWPNAWDAPDQGSKEFSIVFGLSSWGDYTQWEAPP